MAARWTWDAQQAAGVPAEGVRTLRVLVVDDHSATRAGLIRILQQEPDLLVVGEAADGKAALELVERLRPDVVTMDINMPVMNGIQATRAIRAAYPAVRVIGLSVSNDPEYAVVMQEAGASVSLGKHAAIDLLVAAIRECVDPMRRLAEVGTPQPPLGGEIAEEQP